MGAPIPKLDSVGDHSAEALLDSLKTIDPAERRKHATVFNYWQSIRSNRQFPPIRDLDPLEISDAGPWSVLLEMIGGGEDAIVKHFGQAIRDGNDVERISDASAPSLLACIHSKLPIVAACREAYAFEDRYEGEQGTVRCWVTLLPFSQNGTWIDFVYGYVSLDTAGAAEAVAEVVAEEEAAAEPEPEAVEAEAEVAEVEPETEVAEVEPETVEEEPEVAEAEPEPFTVPLAPLDEEYEQAEAAAEPEPETAEEFVEPEPEPVEETIEAVAEEEPVALVEPEPEPEPEYEASYEEEAPQKPGFTKFMESLGGFYGKVVQAGPDLPPESFVEEEPAEEEAAVLPEEVIDEAPAANLPEAEPEEEQPAAELPEAQPEPAPEPAHQVEGTLQSKLTDVRTLAEEAREAQIRSNMALYEGLSAAYDFALDAEEQPEEYLRLVEAQGLKIQLRSPMKPVVKLAFDGTCDEPTIKQLEAVLGWALKQDLPRGTLAERIQSEGGIGAILEGHA
ncbi:hypothetical protein [Sphingomonas alba]|uniref:Uncharacterized protein n=1 Tax=Sphingomonas alba TaxID=2908208 RepID=A0ABT0RQH2_9SPHN|nr:hypothetical protein [Sphingomonas alba]MCL6684539.1 hypothetical protein [Sphingomonas alba]